MSQAPQVVGNLSPRTKWKLMAQYYNFHDAISYLFQQFLSFKHWKFYVEKNSMLLAHLNLIKNPIFYQKQLDRKKYWPQYQFNCQSLTDLKSQRKFLVSTSIIKHQLLNRISLFNCISSQQQRLILSEGIPAQNYPFSHNCIVREGH